MSDVQARVTEVKRACFVYRCRRCGVDYSNTAASAEGGCGGNASLYPLYAIRGVKSPGLDYTQAPHLLALHTCHTELPGQGVADLIGFEEVDPRDDRFYWPVDRCRIRSHTGATPAGGI